MEQEEQKGITPTNMYGEREAIRTAFAICFNTTEEKAELALAKTYDTTGPKGRRALEELRKVFNTLMTAVPAEHRRTVAEQVGHQVLDKMRRRAEIAKLFGSPAVRHSRLIQLTCLFFSREKVAQRFIPILSDYHIEYEEARREGRWPALRVRLLYWYRFADAMRLDALLTALDKFIKIWLMFH